MSACDLEIILDDANGVYYAGQPITGKVQVRVQKNCTCNALTVKLSWFTHGKGNTANGDGPSSSQAVVAQGRWQAGQLLEFPFSITAPPGPVSFHGHYINLDWQIEARADVPLALDPKTAVPIAVIAAPGQAQHFLGDSYISPDQATSQTAGSAILFVGLLVGIIALVMAPIMFSAVSQGGGQSTVPFLMVPGGMGLVALVLVVVGIVKRAAAKQLGPPSANIQPNPAPPGGTVTAQVTVRPKRPVTILGATATITGRERARRGSGSNAHTYTETFLAHTLPHPDGSEVVETGREKTWSWQFLLPQDAPPTLSVRDNHVEWSVKLTIEIDRFPDWSITIPLTVVPAPSVLPTLP